MEADFVKLFGALRKIHGNVTNTNNSAIRQGLPARGYAQLNALTRHHYSSSEEVFAARAMLFAERMVNQADTPDAKIEALWHRAYVLSIVGLDGLGWSDLEQIREMQGGEVDHDQASKFSKAEQWKQLVEPFIKWDSQTLIEVGDQHEELRSWSRRLAFQVIDANRYPGKVFEAATEFASEIPADYGMFAEMTKYHAIQLCRTGARLGPQAFKQLLSESLDSLEDLPGDVKELLPVDEQRREFAQEVVPDLDLNALFTTLNAHISGKLEEESRRDCTNGLSWSVLGRLILEEQFLQAARVLKAARVGTETSNDHLVDQLVSVVNEHRYADYIRCLRYRPDTQTKQCWEHLKKLKVRDPSWKMRPMSLRYFLCAERVDRKLALKFWKEIGRNFTTVDYNRYLFPDDPNIQGNTKKHFSIMGKRFTMFTSFGEAGLRTCIGNAINPDQGQLEEWEEGINKDSLVYYYLGQQYQGINLSANAERCFKKSVDLLPTLASASLWPFLCS